MLTICPHCHRHVRDDEPSCPFCRTRSSRNMQMLAAAAIGLAATSCSGTATYVTSDSASSSASASSASGDAAKADTNDSASLPDYATAMSSSSYGATSYASSFAPPYMAVAPDTGAADTADGDVSDSADAFDACSQWCNCGNPCPAYIVAAYPDRAN